MVAIADEEFLYLLEFNTRRGLAREVERLRAKRVCFDSWAFPAFNVDRD